MNRCLQHSLISFASMFWHGMDSSVSIFLFQNMKEYNVDEGS
jgi:hypothetical protein